MSVANILPRDIIKVELKYTELLVPTDAVYRFVFPTVVGPRYVGNRGDNSRSETWTANPYHQEGELPANTFDITVGIHAGLPIRELSCSTHKVDIDYSSPNDSLIQKFLPVLNVTNLRLNSKHEIRNSKQIQMTKNQMTKTKTSTANSLEQLF